MEEDSGPTVVEYVCKLLQRLYDTQLLVKLTCSMLLIVAKKRQDKKSNHRQFHEGHKVLLLRTSNANKL